MARIFSAFVFALFFSTFSTAASATESAESAEAARYQCSDYNQYGRNASYYCQQDYNCRWDYRRGCIQARQQPQRCEQIRDYRQCQQSGCYWDQYYGCQSGGGGGGRGVWQCTASDQGWEEHRGGHAAQGNSQQQAAQAALQVCQKPYGVHDRCYVTNCQQIR